MTGISLVMATMNRVEEVGVFLQYLSKQSFKKFELIIVDQSSPAIHEDLKSLINKKSFSCLDIKLIHSSLPGLARARNIGLQHVSNEIIGFPDDDCWYSESVLLDTINLIQKNDIYFISGQYTEPGVVNSKFPNFDLKINGYRSASIPSSVGLFIKRSVLDAGISFDENLGAGTTMPIGEETDFVISMIERGFFGFYYHNHIIFHKIQNSNRISFDVILKREIARGYIAGKRIGRFGAAIWAILGLFKILYQMKGIFILKARVVGLCRGGRHFIFNRKRKVRCD